MGITGLWVILGGVILGAVIVMVAVRWVIVNGGLVKGVLIDWAIVGVILEFVIAMCATVGSITAGATALWSIHW